MIHKDKVSAGVAYLLDTNNASYIMRNDKPALTSRMAHVPPSSLAVSSVTEAELRFGVERRPERQLSAAADFFLRHISILPWDSAAARSYAGLRIDLEMRGKLLGLHDMMIAAHALALGATLVSHDKAFTRIKSLKVADWTKA